MLHRKYLSNSASHSLDVFFVCLCGFFLVLPFEKLFLFKLIVEPGIIPNCSNLSCSYPGC